MLMLTHVQSGTTLPDSAGCITADRHVAYIMLACTFETFQVTCIRKLSQEYHASVGCVLWQCGVR